MAACTTYLDPGANFATSVAQHNAELMAQQQLRRRGVRTPEIMFTHHFDNSRLVKASDPVRVRQMRIFSAAVTVLFTLAMIYGFQHFSAIEGSYRVESEKQQLEQLREENRQLKLAEAQLSQPGRIDALAHQLGLAAPQPGQVVRPTAHPDSSSAPVLAQVNATPIASTIQ